MRHPGGLWFRADLETAREAQGFPCGLPPAGCPPLPSGPVLRVGGFQPSLGGLLGTEPDPRAQATLQVRARQKEEPRLSSGGSSEKQQLGSPHLFISPPGIKWNIFLANAS